MNGLFRPQRIFVYPEGIQVGDAGLAHLSSLKSLQTLNLGGPRVGDAGLAHLFNLKSLQSLNLSRTQVSEAGREAFRLKRPDVEL